MNGISLFSGIGGIDLAASLAGFDIRYQVEIDEFCRRVLQKHAPLYWKDAKIYEDVRTFGKAQLAEGQAIDLIFGGFPCQNISISGNGLGLAGESSGLWYEFKRIIGEIRPRCILLENVPAILVEQRGGHEVLADLTALGYDVRWGIIRAEDAGAPHRRERWFAVGFARGNRFHRATSASTGHNPCDDQRHTSLPEPHRQFAIAPQSNGKVAHITRQRFTQISKPHTTLRKRSRLSNHRVRVGNPTRTRLERRSRSKSRFALSRRPSSRTWRGTTQSRMGRSPHGIPQKLDGSRLMAHQFPSPPNQAQHSNEPPRTIAKGLPNRASRVKALGNAVVPQVLYPILKELHGRLIHEQNT